MNEMLNERGRVHRAQEHRHEQAVVVERRAVDERGDHTHGGTANDKLDQPLHPLTIAKD